MQALDQLIKPRLERRASLICDLRYVFFTNFSLEKLRLQVAKESHIGTKILRATVTFGNISVMYKRTSTLNVKRLFVGLIRFRS